MVTVPAVRVMELAWVTRPVVVVWLGMKWKSCGETDRRGETIWRITSKADGTFVITRLDNQTFSYNAGSAVQNENSPASGSPIVTSTSTVITATVPAHGFESGNQVIVAGVNPTSYNDTYTLNKIDDDTFSFTVSSALPPISSIASATATSGTTTATATVRPTSTPVRTVSYTVQPGDSAFEIASRFEVTVEELAEANDRTVASLASLQPGDTLLIPLAR